MPTGRDAVTELVERVHKRRSGDLEFNRLADRLARIVEAVMKRAQSRVDEVEADERFHYPPADIYVNGPLALVQVNMKAIRDENESILDYARRIAEGDDDA